MRRTLLAFAAAVGLALATSGTASAQYYWWVGSPYAGYTNPYLYNPYTVGYGVGAQNVVVNPWTGTQVYQSYYVNPWTGYGQSYVAGYNPWLNQYQYRYSYGYPRWGWR
jgi:hypothetical protein